jgi:hypothetical protein
MDTFRRFIGRQISQLEVRTVKSAIGTALFYAVVIAFGPHTTTRAEFDFTLGKINSILRPIFHAGDLKPLFVVPFNMVLGDAFDALLDLSLLGVARCGALLVAFELLVIGVLGAAFWSIRGIQTFRAIRAIITNNPQNPYGKRGP